MLKYYCKAILEESKMKKGYILLFLLSILLIFTISCKKDEGADSAHEHNYIETVIAPTCKEGGHTNKTCAECGDYIYCNYVSPTSCTPADEWVVTKEPTCSAVGEKQQKCKTCGDTIKIEAIPMLEHQPITNVTKLPTCLEQGIKKTFCGICNKALNVENIPVLQTHDYEIITIPPTTETQGKTIYTCKLCKHSEEGEYLEKISGIEATEIYERASKATVRVEAYDKGGKLSSIGTGFFYTNDGKLITNYHVIATAYTAKIVFYNGDSYTVTQILGYNITQDVAILKIDKSDTDCLEISTQNVKTGDTVYALGNPLGVNNIFTFGMVSNQNMTISGKECIAFTAPISPGNSGGPLMNSKGEVVGINTMYIPDAQNLNFAILIDKATSLSISNPVTTQSQYTTNLKHNAYDILSSYIAHNADHTNEDIYTIVKVVEEQNGNVGLEYKYTYDSELGALTIDVFVIKGAQYKYALTIYLNQGTTIYDVSMYDFEANQYTIEAKIDVSKQNVDYETSFFLFEISAFRYDPAETDKTETRKQFFYTLYMSATQEFKALLQKSYTGLTISSFFTNRSYNQ